MAKSNRKTTTNTTKKVITEGQTSHRPPPDSKKGQTSHRPPPKKGSKPTGGASKEK